jgi:hypothetical protein
MSSKRNLSLTPRAEDTREVQPVSVVNFELSEIKEHFAQSLAAIKSQFEVALSLESEGKTEDQKNIYRSQIVFLESAFDFYLHELTKYGLRKMLVGSWRKTEKYRNLKIPMKHVEGGLNDPSAIQWFVEYINEAYSRDVMTAYEYLKDQMNMLGISLVDILKSVFPEKDTPKKVIIDLYDRRNQIAHQTDRAHADASQADITEKYVTERINEIENIVMALHRAALEKG